MFITVHITFLCIQGTSLSTDVYIEALSIFYGTRVPDNCAIRVGTTHRKT